MGQYIYQYRVYIFLFCIQRNHLLAVSNWKNVINQLFEFSAGAIRRVGPNNEPDH